MKTIGLIGGMSWESSSEYYKIINETIKARLGGLHSAQSLMYSVDFAELEILQRQGKWQEAGQMMAEAAQRLERGGADFIVLCTNTMHKAVDEIRATTHIPLLHIVDPTARQIEAAGLTCVGLLGTRYTMEESFYIGRLTQNFNLQVLIPAAEEREMVNRVIFEELVLGDIRPASRQSYLEIIERLVQRGAQGVILGCTEIGLLVKDGDCAVPLFDTTRLHAEAAVDYALKD